MATKTKSPAAGKGSHDQMLRKFFEDEVKDIYWAEKHVLTTLPKMKKAATSAELQNAFEEHHTQTQTHVQRLSRYLNYSGKKHREKM